MRGCAAALALLKRPYPASLATGALRSVLLCRRSSNPSPPPIPPSPPPPTPATTTQFVLVVHDVVAEKESRVRQAMQTMGLR